MAHIVSEISRLQNSLKYLRETQNVLEATLAETTEPPDAEIADAFEENQVVMYVQADLDYRYHTARVLIYYLNRGSQEERITILKMAITEKGIVPGSHYDPQAMSVSQSSITQHNPSHTTAPSPLIDTALSNVEEDGVYL